MRLRKKQKGVQLHLRPLPEEIQVLRMSSLSQEKRRTAGLFFQQGVRKDIRPLGRQFYQNEKSLTLHGRRDGYQEILYTVYPPNTPVWWSWRIRRTQNTSGRYHLLTPSQLMQQEFQVQFLPPEACKDSNIRKRWIIPVIYQMLRKFYRTQCDRIFAWKR